MPHRRICVLLLAASGAAHAADLNVLSFGGANKAAQEIAYYQPFHRASGVGVYADDYDGHYYREIVAGRNSPAAGRWDVVEVSAPELARGCAEGRFEKLDWAAIAPREAFLPGATSECGAGIFTWSAVLAYNQKLLARAPQGWADFWDTRRFAGKRAMNRSARYTLEAALLADGVPASEVYPTLSTDAGVRRAFRKLDALRPHVVWWESPAQPAQMLAFEQASMALGFSGRIARAARDWPQLKVSWQGNIGNVNYWAIPKGGDTALATSFIAFASQPDNQATYSRYIDYGPTRKEAIAQLPAELAQRLPGGDANRQGALQLDSAFWAANGKALEARFERWLSSGKP